MVIAPNGILPGASIMADGARVQSVWLDQPETAYERCHGLLSADEKARASRFVFERDRRHFVVCRGSLRAALGALLDRDPGSLAFVYSSRGKPSLRGGELNFNVTHSAGLALFAFSETTAVGVDVESLDRQVDAESLASRFFSADEVADLMSVALQDRTEAFFNCWTRKESYIKAVGDGLHCPLDSFSVSLRPGDRAAIRWIDGDDAGQWQLEAFRPAQGYVAAISRRRTSGIRG